MLFLLETYQAPPAAGPSTPGAGGWQIAIFAVSLFLLVAVR